MWSIFFADGEGASSQAGARKRENSTSQSDYSPGDTEKFLKFAGTLLTCFHVKKK